MASARFAAVLTGTAGYGNTESNRTRAAPLKSAGTFAASGASMRTAIEPCLCGDPECPRCFSGNDAWRAKQYRKALVQIANASAGDYQHSEDAASYWQRFSAELRHIARDALDYT
jgi:hypothetical protein